MSTPNKPKKSPVVTGTRPISTKQAVKAAQAVKKRKQQQQQQAMLIVGALAILAVVVIAIVIQNRPVEAPVPEGVADTYKVVREKGWVGKTESGDHYIGRPDAPTTMEEFSSFSCSACFSFHNTTFKSLLDKVNAGDLKFVYKPITTTGSWDSTNQTKAAYCAGEQGQFFEFHDTLFSWWSSIGAGGNDSRRLSAVAEKLGLDIAKYNACMGSSLPTDSINRVAAEATSRGVNATPTVFMNNAQLGRMTRVYPDREGTSQPASLAEMRGLIEAAAKK